MLLVLASLGGCDLLTTRETLIADSAAVVTAVDDPQGIAGPIRYTLSSGISVEVQLG